MAAGALSDAKNQAIAAARGEILAFTDDDCYPRSDYLLALADVFQANDVGVVGGRVVRHDPTDANVSIRDDDTAASIETGTFVYPGTVHGANLALRREVLAAIGGFDPLLGPGTPCVAAEDIDLVARAVLGGVAGPIRPRSGGLAPSRPETGRGSGSCPAGLRLRPRRVLHEVPAELAGPACVSARLGTSSRAVGLARLRASAYAGSSPAEADTSGSVCCTAPQSRESTPRRSCPTRT